MMVLKYHVQKLMHVAIAGSLPHPIHDAVLPAALSFQILEVSFPEIRLLKPFLCRPAYENRQKHLFKYKF